MMCHPKHSRFRFVAKARDPDTNEIVNVKDIKFKPSDRGAGNWPTWFCEKAEQCGVDVTDEKDEARAEADSDTLQIVGVAKVSPSNVKFQQHGLSAPWPPEGRLLWDLYGKPMDACLIGVDAAAELEEPLAIRRRWILDKSGKAPADSRPRRIEET